MRISVIGCGYLGAVHAAAVGVRGGVGGGRAGVDGGRALVGAGRGSVLDVLGGGGGLDR